MTTYPLPQPIIQGSTDAEDGVPTLHSAALAGNAQNVIADPGDYPYTLATGLSGVNLVITGSDGDGYVDDQGDPSAFPGTRGQTAVVAVEYFTRDTDGNVSASAGTCTLTLRANRLPAYTPASATVTHGATTTIDLSNALSDADGQDLSLANVSAANGTVNSVLGRSVNYTAPASGSSDTITFDVSDGLETRSGLTASVALQAGSGITVGTAAIADGTADFSGVAHGLPNQTHATFWAIVARTTGGISDFIRLTDDDLNRLQLRANLDMRLFADDGPDSSYAAIVPADGLNLVDGEVTCYICSVAPNGTGGSLIRVAGRGALGGGWVTRSVDAAAVSEMAISGGLLRLYTDFAGSIIRAGVAVGVALDPAAAAVQDAIWDSDGEVPVASPGTLAAALSGGTILVDQYGGPTVFNSEQNPGGTLDLAGSKTGTFT
jgi:hypothetical protein